MGLIDPVGLLMLAGIIVNNGIVFVDYANHIRHRSGNDSRSSLKNSVSGTA